jgi:hypothetical protein
MRKVQFNLIDKKNISVLLCRKENKKFFLSLLFSDYQINDLQSRNDIIQKIYNDLTKKEFKVNKVYEWIIYNNTEIKSYLKKLNTTKIDNINVKIKNTNQNLKLDILLINGYYNMNIEKLIEYLVDIDFLTNIQIKNQI